jgi:acetyl esterase/lipase
MFGVLACASAYVVACGSSENDKDVSAATLPDAQAEETSHAFVSDAAADGPTPAGDLITPSYCAYEISGDAGPPNVATNVTYGTLPPFPNALGTSAQQLDVAWPNDGAQHPLVLLIHGGAWAGGSALDDGELALYLASNGFVAATVDYRLADGSDGGVPINPFPAQISDVRCALRFMRAHAADYHVDTSRIVTMGESAGGHLAAMLATASKDPSLDDGTCPADLASQSLEIKWAVGMYGPYDLRDLSAFEAMPSWSSVSTAVGWFLNAHPDGGVDPKMLSAASPITYVDENSAPMLLVHGSADPLVPIAQAPALENALRAAGVEASYVEVPDAGHGFPEISDDPVLQPSVCLIHGLLFLLDPWNGEEGR